MILSPIKRLCILLPTIISALPQASTPVSLPASLQQTVPACAQPCLRASLFNQFPIACTAQADLGCLCSLYSTGGETLGEVALGCIYASCSTVDSGAASAYNVCLGQIDAVQPTQTALTVTASSLAMSKLTATPKAPTTLRSTPAITTSSESSATTFMAIIASTSQSSSTTLPSTEPSVNASVAEAASPRTMKPAQIAGLSVAAAATFILAIGLMVLSVFLRRRREKRVAEMVSNEKRPQNWTRKPYSMRFSKRFQAQPRQSTYKRISPSHTGLDRTRQWASVGLTSVSQTNRDSNFGSLNHAVHSVPVNLRFDSRNSGMARPVFPPSEGGAKASPNAPVPLDRIGLAISELPDNNVPIIHAPKPPERTQPRQSRPKSLARRRESTFGRDSVLTQDTVFEEDVPPERRRSSKLLPIPPVPIPPIRTFQPSRMPLTTNHLPQPKQTYLNRPSGPQQPALSLNIPVRHSGPQPKPIQPQETELRRAPRMHAPEGKPMLDLGQSRSIASSTESPELSNEGYIPDYYFSSPATPPAPNVSRAQRAKQSQRVVNNEPKAASNTASRATSSRSGTASVRDSVSSQTSFETADPNDPTPEDENDEKQLSYSRLSPLAESPISSLRYPKVPRASNQLVPRSPRSPHNRSSDGSPKRVLGSPSLLVKRRGEQQAHALENQLRMKAFRQRVRSTSNVEHWQPQQDEPSHRNTRSQSGLWPPTSPLMYGEDAVQPLHIRDKPTTPGIEALKSPAWVPKLTPTRQGDDLFLSVTYAKPGK
ncbi:hypothetical protein GQ43DRAFT_107465 [Delitschia confertaspora ATCC 74209]|uniref:Extracellular membrane protein CFEM domain-containing protein n=1 Tax=Delitschia confertaspora ATCC 74209 TaxID=1513339 RepID=A0A9P4JK00_9PLEO|nr:hypothetical protein GQ43DRAFT_107465 [Delitschia confertaspora ATCC 74209]